MPTLERPTDILSVARQTRYPLDAFLFVQRGLDYTVRREHGEMDEHAEAAMAMGQDVPSRHISGRQLCEGLREYAITEYGLLARTVLRRWNICRSDDFGRIVFAMVEAGLMHKTEDDRLEDFDGVFDFGSAFGRHLLLSDG